jgi:hypothetical protein
MKDFLPILIIRYSWRREARFAPIDNPTTVMFEETQIPIVPLQRDVAR